MFSQSAALVSEFQAKAEEADREEVKNPLYDLNAILDAEEQPQDKEVKK